MPNIPLRLEVVFNPFAKHYLRPPGHPQIIDRFTVYREETPLVRPPYSGAIFPIVARVEKAATSPCSLSIEFDKTYQPNLFARAQQTGVTCSARSVAVTPSRRLPGHMDPQLLLESKNRPVAQAFPPSASMPPTPHPTIPSPLIIVVCESVPTSVSG